MDKAEFKKKYDELLIEFNKKYKNRSKKLFNDADDKIAAKYNDYIKKENKEDFRLLLVDTIADEIEEINKINIDYTRRLIYFMLENFITDTDKEK